MKRGECRCPTVRVTVTLGGVTWEAAEASSVQAKRVQGAARGPGTALNGAPHKWVDLLNTFQKPRRDPCQLLGDGEWARVLGVAQGHPGGAPPALDCEDESSCKPAGAGGGNPTSREG